MYLINIFDIVCEFILFLDIPTLYKLIIYCKLDNKYKLVNYYCNFYSIFPPIINYPPFNILSNTLNKHNHNCMGCNNHICSQYYLVICKCLFTIDKSDHSRYHPTCINLPTNHKSNGLISCPICNRYSMYIKCNIYS